MLVEHRVEKPDRIVKTIVNAARTFAAGAGFHDDVAALAMRVVAVG
ncbi:MAG: hypothetical protein ABR591_05725 [Candidatus Velthaea sp.]